MKVVKTAMVKNLRLTIANQVFRVKEIFSAALALSLVAPASAQGADTTGWEQINLDGDTKCADGSNYSIFMNRGPSGRLVIDFMGGGACWDDETCSPDAINYTKSVPDIIGRWLPEASGIYDRTRDDNPFRNDTHVLLPYCTGDVHWGHADKSYRNDDGSPFTVHHRGAINARSSLDFVFSQADIKPNEVFITGCSAGAYASIWWTPYIRRLASQAKLIQFSDSGAGVLSSQFRHGGMRNWQIEKSAPWWIPGLNPAETDLYQLTLDEMYTAVANAHPEIQLAEYNSLNDVLQRWFFHLMGGNLYDWTDLMRQSVESAAERSNSFRYYIAPWDAHCILPYESFFAKTSDAPNGIPFHDWMARLLNNADAPNEPCNGCQIDRP
jgi:hypothetical protein